MRVQQRNEYILSAFVNRSRLSDSLISDDSFPKVFPAQNFIPKHFHSKSGKHSNIKHPCPVIEPRRYHYKYYFIFFFLFCYRGSQCRNVPCHAETTTIFCFSLPIPKGLSYLKIILSALLF